MVLNIDCVRDVLLAIESYDLNEKITVKSIRRKIQRYSFNDILYTCLKLEDGGYIEMETIDQNGKYIPQIVEIYWMTFSGHEYLNLIRNDSQWKRIRFIMDKIGSFGLSTAESVASSLLSTGIQKLL